MAVRVAAVCGSAPGPLPASSIVTKGSSQSCPHKKKMRRASAGRLGHQAASARAAAPASTATGAAEAPCAPAGHWRRAPSPPARRCGPPLAAAAAAAAAVQGGCGAAGCGARAVLSRHGWARRGALFDVEKERWHATPLPGWSAGRHAWRRRGRRQESPPAWRHRHHPCTLHSLNRIARTCSEPGASPSGSLAAARRNPALRLLMTSGRAG